MVETLKELNQVCQKPRYKEEGNWMVRTFLRDAALPVTWLVLHTPMTANQVTTLSLLIGLWGISLFAVPGAGMFLVGCLLLQLWYFLDHVDGQVARYRKTTGLNGRFFDFLTHHLIHTSIFFSLGVYAFQMTESLFFIVWGFTASLAVLIFNLIHDTKYKTFVEALPHEKVFKINKTGDADPVSKNPAAWAGVLSKVFSFFHKSSEIHVLMNLLTLGAVLEVCRVPLDFRLLYLFFYGCTLPLMSVVKITYLLMGHRIDEEFHAVFREVEAKGR